MKRDKLFEEIGLIRDSHVAEADTVIKLPSAKRPWAKRTSIAAAACLVIAMAFIAIPQLKLQDPTYNPPVELPMLTISDNTEAFGFEGYLAYDISELANGNPWIDDVSIKTLPVFKNPTGYDSAGMPVSGLSADTMIRIAEKTATLLGLTVDSVYTNPTAENLQREKEKVQALPGEENYEPDATQTEAVAICGDVTIKVQANGAVRIFFESEIQLPGEYSLTYYDTTEAQAIEATHYLLEQYKAVVGMTSPALALFGDYTYEGQRGFDFVAYEKDGSLIEQILGYNFNQIQFSPNEDGALWIIDRYSADLSQKIADYPIIFALEAKGELLRGRYITTVPEEFPGEEYIARVELVYRTGRHDEMFMPYYKFLVEMPSMQRDNGLKTFGAYYVPAVESQYISNMPLWDGSFN